MDPVNIKAFFQKYRYVIAVLLIGVVLMLLPDAPKESENTQIPQPEPEAESMEERLEGILTLIEGAGEVSVMLTESAGEEILYQTDGEKADTVLITDANRNQQGLIRTRQPPQYRGAIVVCGGADSAAVRLAVVEAVANVTGLGSNQITVLKMEQEVLS